MLPAPLALSALFRLLPTASALSLTLQDSSSPEAGITVERYHVASPDTDVYVARIDLCAPYVHVDATRATASYQTTGSWASGHGVALATNGDFYRTGPSLVYGNAVGGGVAWPLDMTGLDPSNSGEWFWGHHGWIAFGPDWVEFTHSGHIKNNQATWNAMEGWEPTTNNASIPPGTLAIVSGFPELVIEGVQYTCSDPEASTCFPDRSDMRDRHPRTAMGITADRQTFLLVVADGRTSSNDGLYGAELADIMYQLGAWEAFNLDGGGSSQMWTEADGYLNDYSGNNYGSGARSVMNHWGVFAGSWSGRPARPGHCASEPACDTVPPAGGTLDDTSACVELFGDPDYWRSESAGQGGGLRWTNAFESDSPDNWGWWQLEMEEAGDYAVEVYLDPAWSVFDQTRYQIRADGGTAEVVIDQGASSGWTALGTYAFAAGGDQWVSVFDDAHYDVASSQHVSFDALRLTRVGPWCGDATCDAGESCEVCAADCTGPAEITGNGIDDDCDPGTPDTEPEDSPPDSGDSDPGDSDPARDDSDPARDDSDPGGDSAPLPPKGQVIAEEGCGCAAHPDPRALSLLLPALALLARRRR